MVIYPRAHLHHILRHILPHLDRQEQFPGKYRYDIDLITE
jgi:hypothetical protein